MCAIIQAFAQCAIENMYNRRSNGECNSGRSRRSKNFGLLQYLQSQIPAITTLLYTINTKKNDSLHGLEPVVYSGKGYVIEKLENFQYKIGPKSFFKRIQSREKTVSGNP
jgi:hypothetical protein